MGLFSRKRTNGNGDVAVADEPVGYAPASDRTGEALLQEIDDLTRENRTDRSAAREQRILRLRHQAALELIADSPARPGYPEPAFEALPEGSSVPEVAAAELTPEILRAAILRSGCLLVRGLIDTGEATRLRDEIDSAFEAKESEVKDETTEAYWSAFEADSRFDLSDRQWIGGRSNAWGVDSPRVMVDLFDTFERTGFRQVATGYLGERPAISVNKCTLRRVHPEDFEENKSSSWHQDGAFMGGVRALNVWLSLSRAGDRSPGLDVVPRRLEEIVPTGTEGAAFDWSVATDVAQSAAGDVG
ncbi:MAG: hypothetical protein H0V25_00210, partial [Solirubrobacterales bacterium]|nr:hypothetical protein [Solirubrobacterales bacterium]